MGNKNSGRKPKANALKLLRGVTRQDRLNADEPTPTGEVQKPSDLSAFASAIWDEVAPVCLSMQTLTAADVSAFMALCELEATRRKASAEKNEKKFSIFLYTTTVDGAGNEHVNVKEHPALKLERETAQALRPYFDYFGMTPSGRARIRVPKKAEAATAWADIA